MRSFIAAGSLVALVCATAIGAAAAPVPGSLLNGTLTQSYSSNHAYRGEPVVLRNVTADDGSGSVTGGTLYGTVSSVQPAGQGRPGRIQFEFYKLVTGSGATYSVNATVTRMKANTKNNALKEAGGTVAGMLVGNAIGKTLFHVGGFGAIGAVGGFLLAKNNHQNINVDAGTIVQVQLNSVTRRQSH